MSLTATTASAAIGASDTSIVVASATGFAAGNIVKVDQELMRVTQTYVSGTTIPVLRGQQGGVAQAHPASAKVLTGLATDFPSAGPQVDTTYPLAGKVRQTTSVTTDNSTLTLPTGGQDMVVELNGTSVIHLTVPVPTKDMENTLLWIASNGAAAHVITFTGGLSGAGTSYDVITVNATAPVLLGPFMAVNGLWQMEVSVPLAGTVTNLTATVA